jgi:patatin-like phospholipase/acyl hydrolase
MKILSIDGGGIRGIIPARILSELEQELQNKEGEEARLCNYFDLICGTSTGGIIAIGIALGIPAKDILKLYKENAKKIFPKIPFIRWMRRWIPQWVLHIFTYVCKGSLYQNKALKELLEKHYGIDTKINDCKTRLCVTTYGLRDGKMHILKTKHHQDYTRDLHMRAVDAALATAAAPVYFEPYSYQYSIDEGSLNYEQVCDVDGGVYANNPALIGLIEAHCALEREAHCDKEKERADDIHLLSIGTGEVKFKEKDIKKEKGIKYWITPDKSSSLRIYELMASAQSSYIDNMLKIMCKGIGGNKEPKFDYLRIQQDLDTDIPMDTSDPDDLEELERIGADLWFDNSKELKKYIETKVTSYKEEENNG